MCTAALAFAGISAVGSAVADRQAQMAQYQAQRAAVLRSNALARQKFDHETLMIAKKEKEKGRIFEAELEANAAAQTALAEQQRVNQLEQIRASEANQLKLSEKRTELAFKGQELLASKVQAQGTTLASGMASGQSMLLELGQAERKLGLEQATLAATMFDATKSMNLTEYGIGLSQYSADNKAMNMLPSVPNFAPTAELSQQAPIFQEPPSKPSMLGSILTGVTTGVKVGSGIGGTDSKTWWGGNK